MCSLSHSHAQHLFANILFSEFGDGEKNFVLEICFVNKSMYAFDLEETQKLVMCLNKIEMLKQRNSK